MTDPQLARLLRHLSAAHTLTLLGLVRAADGPGSTELARSAGMSAAHTATALRLMTAQGLVQRHAAACEGRRCEWRLSDRGELVMRMLDRMRRVLDTRKVRPDPESEGPGPG